MREARICHQCGAVQPVLGEQFENVIALSYEFYSEVIAHPIPADMKAVKLLAAAPADLDLFIWLTYRCITAKGRELIPIYCACGLVSQLGSVE
jgi:hypothetical protein